MRTKNSLRNTIFSVCGYGLVFILGLLLRKVFILNLDFSNLGYESLFTNIFGVLAVADLGAGSLITYRMYAAFAAQDQEEVARLTALYRRLGWLLTAVILVLGVAVMPLLPLLIRDNVSDWGYVRLIYLLQMAALCASHPFAYSTTLLNADQKNHETVSIWAGMRIATQVIKCVSILLFKSYILYLLLTLFCNVLTGVITLLRCRQLYPNAVRGRCTFSDFRKEQFGEELTGVGVSRILNAFYFATDSVLLSAMLGVRSVAMYGNYTVISKNINDMFVSLLQPVSSSIGNYVNTESQDDSFQLFTLIDLISFFCASFALTSYGVLLQPVIGLLFGAEFLLPESFTVLFSITHYLTIKCLGLNSFRGTFGHFKEEWLWLGTAAAANIVLSIVGCKLWGVTGIVFGTVISLITIWAGKSILSFRYCFSRPGAGYMFKQALRFLLALAEFALAYAITRGLPYDIGGVALRALICLLLPNLLNILIYRRTEAFSQMCAYAGRVYALLKTRGGKSADSDG